MASIDKRLSLIFMIEPLPNWRSIWLIAAARAFSFSGEIGILKLLVDTLAYCFLRRASRRHTQQYSTPVRSRQAFFGADLGPENAQMFAIGAAFITTKLSYPEQQRIARIGGGTQQFADGGEKHRDSALVFDPPLATLEIHPKRQARRLQYA
jgi:hypothetical protein